MPDRMPVSDLPCPDPQACIRCTTTGSGSCLSGFDYPFAFLGDRQVARLPELVGRAAANLFPNLSLRITQADYFGGVVSLASSLEYSSPTCESVITVIRNWMRL